MHFSQRILQVLASRSFGEPAVRLDGPPKRILVIRLNRLGDLVCALPVYRTLQLAFPEAEIDWLLSPQNAALAAFLRPRGQVHVFEKGPNRYWIEGALMRRLQAREYDLSIAVKGGYDPLLAWISLAVGAKQRIGYFDHESRRLDFAYTHPKPRPESHQHQVEKGLGLIHSLAGAKRSDETSLEVPGAALESVRALLSQRGIQPKRYVVLQLSSTKRDFMQWPLANYAQLAKQFLDQGMCVCVNGLESDRSRLEEFCRSSPGAVPMIFPGMAEYLAFLKMARLVIGTDGGGLHLAAAVGTRTIGFYAESHPVKWRPWGEGHEQFYTAGRPVAEISVEDVRRAGQAALKDQT